MKDLFKKYLSKIVRFIAREMADEIKVIDGKPAGVANYIKVDVSNMLEQLGSDPVRHKLIHYHIWNHRWVALLAEKNRRAASNTFDFIEESMPNAVFSKDQFSVIESKKAEMLQARGYILDLGVYKGGSTRALSRIFPDETIHGFDSFEGLPGDWSHVLKGDFGDVKGILPNTPNNVKLYKGWFDDTLPEWIERNNSKQVSILRVDCDIYSSTKTIFSVLKPLIKKDTWIVFDELIGYFGWEQHEYKAFMEFIAETKFEYEYVAYGLTYTIVRIV